MKLLNKIEAGFTLIEVAIVLLVVTILLGYTVAMFPVQQELKQYREANAEMDEIVDALIAFAQVNGRLPCPDTTGDVNVTGVPGTFDGLEDTDDLIVNNAGTAGIDNIIDNCKSFFGFLPSATLGMNGDKNDQNQLVDPWGNAYGYAVSNINANTNPTTTAARDLISPNGIREEGLANVVPDLFICDDSNATGDDLTCLDVSGGPDPVVGNVAVVIVSLGKSNDLSAAASNIQEENFDDFNNGTNDKVYISTERSDAAASEFDDIVRWISPSLLYSKMIEADQLP